jgi:hypothetical protein
MEAPDIGGHVHSCERRQVLDPEEIGRYQGQTNNGSRAECGCCQWSPPTLARTLSLSTVHDRTDPADMESMLEKYVPTLMLGYGKAGSRYGK